MNMARQQEPAGLDWDLIWRQSCRRRKSDRNDREFWNKRAPSFADHARESSYVTDFIRITALPPQWSVLDVGCAAGTLAIPLAAKVRTVTAVDFSENMLAILSKRCHERGITNVQTRLLAWEDDWQAAAIEKHDVAIASRSLVVEDLSGAIKKLASMARHRVIISSLVSDGPFDRRIFQAIDRDLDRGPDYICVYNLLHQMGIYADVTFIDNGGEEKKTFMDLDDAVSGYRWMIGDMTHEEERRLRSYLEKHLEKTKEGYALDYLHPVRWAILSWNKG
ncbi:MAG: class I SAM-dependent methyltransferase [Pseudomonadota bacterium]